MTLKNQSGCYIILKHLCCRCRSGDTFTVLPKCISTHFLFSTKNFIYQYFGTSILYLEKMVFTSIVLYDALVFRKIFYCTGHADKCFLDCDKIRKTLGLELFLR